MIFQRLRSNWMLPTILVLSVLLVSLVMQLPRSPQAEKSAKETMDIPTSLPMAVEEDPVAMAVAKVSGENPMEGIQALLAMADGDSPNVDAVIALGRFSIQSGQFDKARSRFAQAIELAPDRTDPLIQLGMLELDQDQPADALVHFEKALALDSTQANALFFIAQSYERLTRTDLALSFYARFLPLAPDTAIAAGVQQKLAVLQSQINS
jgi:cytochrome c-type biogenesis protein CcmH/NrfG